MLFYLERKSLGLMNNPIMKVITQRVFTSSFEPIKANIGLAMSATHNVIIAATTTRIKSINMKFIILFCTMPTLFPMVSHK